MYSRRWKAKAFLAEERGNITIFSFVMMTTILVVLGGAVDIMRQEAKRAKLQSTMDRAVLAAADLDQKGDPKAVVRDYMAKAGLGDAITGVEVKQGLNYRTVKATGNIPMDAIFLRMVGYDHLNVPAVSVAEEKISNVEISLVVDVSSSMSGTRITNLKTAADEFVETVVRPIEPGNGLTTVNLVPYHSAVNLGETVGDYWNIENLHDYSHCVLFEDQDFNTIAMNPAASLRRMGHFDIYSRNESETKAPRPLCDSGDGRAVVVHSTNKAFLKQRISQLFAQGGTAIHVGVKWGAAFLHNSTRGIVSQMITDKHIVTQAQNRPADKDDPEALKFIVVMTDGQNYREYDLRPQYRDNPSRIFVDERGTPDDRSDDRYSVIVEDNAGTHNDVFYYDRFKNYSTSYRYQYGPDGGYGATRRLSWHEVFDRMGVKAAARRFYYKPARDRRLPVAEYQRLYYYSYQTVVQAPKVHERLTNICNAAKAEGIVIFSVAFEAPDEGAAAMRACASSPAHFFDVDGVEITETFHAIARQINNLRLVQ